MKIAPDKIGHAILGAIVGATVAAAVRLCGFDWIISGISGTVAAGLVGVGKEIYDYAKPKQHTVEAADAMATFAPGALAAWGVALLAWLVLGGCSLWERAESARTVEVERRTGTDAGQPVDLLIRRETQHDATATTSSPAGEEVARAIVDATPWGGLLGAVGTIGALAVGWLKNKQAKDESDYSDAKDAELRQTQAKLNKALAHLPEAKAKEVIE